MGMATNYRAQPKILVQLNGASQIFLEKFGNFLDGQGHVIHWNLMSSSVLLDVDEAEKVVEWLKAHGVEPRK